MIGRADGAMLPRLRQIWQTCFNDTPKGTEFVFSHLLHPDQMLVYTDEESRPAAMINWKLLPFTTPTGRIMGAYIFGVATLPQYRGKGISRRMMSHLHEMLKGEGAALSCLIPASQSLFDFYGGQGFEPFFSYRLAEVAAEEIDMDSPEGTLTPTSLEILEPLRNQAFAGRSLFGVCGAGQPLLRRRNVGGFLRGPRGLRRLPDAGGRYSPNPGGGGGPGGCSQPFGGASPPVWSQALSTAAALGLPRKTARKRYSLRHGKMV